MVFDGCDEECGRKLFGGIMGNVHFGQASAAKMHGYSTEFHALQRYSSKQMFSLKIFLNQGKIY